ncbi:hypothetical protein AGR4A_Lc60003 [Agrobacterium tumefaciens str. B6]|uniref:Uncharacterized protein n=1 Tax=Agrobacterium tumefaciens str. B6 TaxID=1183423 RepID=A0A822V9G2_AGRTU|nr:hypothetical protein AGR4A_Lc60003 [Agrobacterium tumefaciens str. B6]
MSSFFFCLPLSDCPKTYDCSPILRRQLLHLWGGNLLPITKGRNGRQSKVLDHQDSQAIFSTYSIEIERPVFLICHAGFSFYPTLRNTKELPWLRNSSASAFPTSPMI